MRTLTEVNQNYTVTTFRVYLPIVASTQPAVPSPPQQRTRKSDTPWKNFSLKKKHVMGRLNKSHRSKALAVTLHLSRCKLHFNSWSDCLQTLFSRKISWSNAYFYGGPSSCQMYQGESDKMKQILCSDRPLKLVCFVFPIQTKVEKVCNIRL